MPAGDIIVYGKNFKESTTTETPVATGLVWAGVGKQQLKLS